MKKLIVIGTALASVALLSGCKTTTVVRHSHPAPVIVDSHHYREVTVVREGPVVVVHPPHRERDRHRHEYPRRLPDRGTPHTPGQGRGDDHRHQPPGNNGGDNRRSDNRQDNNGRDNRPSDNRRSDNRRDDNGRDNRRSDNRRDDNGRDNRPGDNRRSDNRRQDAPRGKGNNRGNSRGDETPRGRDNNRGREDVPNREARRGDYR